MEITPGLLYYSRIPHPWIHLHILAEDDEHLVAEQRGAPYLIMKESGMGYGLPSPLPMVENKELLTWAKSTAIRLMLN